MTVVSGRAAGAALVLGSACWVSTLVFDRVGTGAGTRVAFLSSWQELIGLTVFAFLLVLLGKAAVQHALAPVGAERAVPGDLLLPVAVLGALALPYLPYVPDAIPALDALAGPGRFLVWAVVLGQIAWATAGTVVAARRRDKPPLAFGHQLLIVGAMSLVLFLVCAWRLEGSPVYPGGDEPHYLVVTQSLLRDGDLAIADNHARGEYREYYPGILKPDYRVTGKDGQIYSIHPVGLSVLIAPAFALGGYRGALLFIACLAALAVTLAWRWAARLTGSPAAATVSWLAVATSAPFVLHSFSIYPECVAALAVVVALGPGLLREEASRSDALIRGLALASLPWLSTKYGPMSGVIWLLLAWRAPLRRTAVLTAPYGASVALWLGFFWWLYGTPSPAAPYGAEHQMSLASLKAGLPGLFADQEYGALASAPGLALAAIGAWRLVRRDAAGRRLAARCIAPLVTLAVTTGAFALWWGGSAPPGRELVAALPLLAVPLAWLWHTSAARPVERTALEWLVTVGAVLTATLVLAHGGLLIANGRDGTSALLEFLDPGRYLARAAPSFIGFRDHVAVPLAASAIWIVIAGVAWLIVGRLPGRGRGSNQLRASLVGLGALLAAAAAVPAALQQWLPAPVAVEAQFATGLLDRYDARARPRAVVYDPLRMMSPADALSDIVFIATPGMHRAPQPLHVLLNARLSLAAGTYRATLLPDDGKPLTGSLGLQVGRIGPPLVTWPLAAGVPATADFTLDLDSSFVAFRASPDLESAVSRLEVRPLSIVDAGARMHRPPVLAAAEYGAMRLYFHDDRVYLESGGFWTKGRTTVTLTVVPRDASTEGPSIRLRVHGGPRTPATLRLATPAWSGHVDLPVGATVEVAVPSRPDLQMLPLALTVDSGFVPAETGGAADDHRWLGCWVEVVTAPTGQ